MKPINLSAIALVLVLGPYTPCHAQTIAELAKLAPGWDGIIAAMVAQSYAGWDVELGDADNDGKNEIRITGCPDSRLCLVQSASEGWQPAKVTAPNQAPHSLVLLKNANP